MQPTAERRNAFVVQMALGFLLLPTVDAFVICLQEGSGAQQSLLRAQTRVARPTRGQGWALRAVLKGESSGRVAH